MNGQDATVPSTGPVSISATVPAQPPSIDLLRTVISSVATQLDFSLEEMSDLGLAAEEACAYLLASYPGARRVTMRIALPDGDLDVCVRLEEPADPSPSDGRRTLVWEVLDTLTDHVDLDLVDGSPAVRFRKASSHRPAS